MLSDHAPIVVADETPLALTPVVTETVDLVNVEVLIEIFWPTFFTSASVRRLRKV